MKKMKWTGLLALAALGLLWISKETGKTPMRATNSAQTTSSASAEDEGAGRATGGITETFRTGMPIHARAVPVPPGTNGKLVRHAGRHWPEARLLGHWTVRDPSLPAIREVMLLRDDGFPYRLRMELVRHPDGREEVREMVADHVLVRFESPAAARRWARERKDPGLRLADAIGDGGLHRVSIEGDPPLALVDALRELRTANGPVAYAEPDYVARLFAEPDDPRYRSGALWGLDNRGNPAADISAPEGWAIRNAAPEVVVGVVDTGVFTGHEDLRGNLWTNPDEVEDGIDNDGNGYIDDVHGFNAIDLNGDPADDKGHGTHVAGTIGAEGDNGLGITGVAWEVQLMPLKFISASGGGAISDAILCVEYGMEKGVDIFSNSWGSSSYSRAFHETVEAARDAGILMVVAAGNFSTNNDLSPVFPASLPVGNMVTVASTDRRDTLSTFSSFGQGFVDIAAPGTDILSAGIDAGDSYRTLSGTSMATPHVSGALALLRAEFPGENPRALLHRLYRGADPLPGLADGTVGFGGRLNLAGALSSALPRPRNDDFASARPLYGDSVVLRTSNEFATTEAGEPALAGETTPRSVWYRFTPLADGQATVRNLSEQPFFDPIRGSSTPIANDAVPALLGVFTGNRLSALETVVTGAEEVTFVVEAGMEYHIAAAGAGDTQGLLVLEVVGPPRNSEFANAVELELSRAMSGTNRNALAEPGEPDHGGSPATASIWYKWTATVTGTVGFSTRNSDFATRVSAYEAASLPAGFGDLVPLAYDSGGEKKGFGRVTFPAVTGRTYYFAVDGKEGAQGNVSALLALVPPNDDFADSTVWSGTDLEREVTTSFASRETGEPVHLPGRGTGETVWFSWTAPADMRMSFSSSGSFLPAILGVYTGNAVDALDLVARDGAAGRGSTVIFEALEGTTYRLVIEGWDRPLSQLPVRLRAIPSPPNDAFADATVLSGRSATAAGSVAGAGREVGEPSGDANAGGSVWFRWTAPANEEIGLYAERLDKPRLWNPVLNLYSGDELTGLNHLKTEYGNGIGRDGYLRWAAEAGTTYRIQVTSLDANQLTGGGGPFTLRLAPVAETAPANDDFDDARVLDGATVYNFRTANHAAGEEAGEPDHGTVSPDRTLWWKFTPETTGEAGRYALSTALSETALVGAVYRAEGPGPHSFKDLVPIAHNRQAATHTFPDLAWNAQPGWTYYIALSRAAGSYGRVLFHFHKVPRNHVFRRAKTIFGPNANLVAHNWGTVRENGEPTLGAPSGQLGSRSLWWKWKAPFSGRFKVDTIGSETPAPEDNVPYPGRTLFGFDTRLGVFTGDSLGTLTRVALNDSRAKESYGNSWIAFQRNSRLDFEAVEGRTYYFLVNGENLAEDGTTLPTQTNTGRIKLNLAPLPPPANDDFADATRIDALPFAATVSNYGATRETGEPLHGGINGGRTLWWRWTAPSNGPVVVSTAGNLYDDYHARRTGLAVYTGPSWADLQRVASDQNSAGVNTGKDTWSLITFQATAGTPYYFAADAAYPGNLSFILTSPPANDDFADAIEMVGSRWATTGHHMGATTEEGEPRVDGGYISVPDNNFRSVWWKWTAPASGEVSLDTLGSQSLNVIGVFTGHAVDALTAVTPVPVSGGNPFNGDAENRARNGNNGGPLFFTAVAGTTYHISVQGSGFVVPSSGPLRLSLEGPPALPFAPAWLRAVRTGTDRVELEWADTAVDEESYLVEKRASGGEWTRLGETPPDTTAFTDPSAGGAGDLHYRVRARNSVGDSPWRQAEWRTSLQRWRHENFATYANEGPAADHAAPSGDLVPNLLKYAFNLDPAAFDRRILGPGNRAGLPAVAMGGTAGERLTVELLRRRADRLPGIAYVIEFDDNPHFSSPQTGTASSVTALDPTWERVLVRDPEPNPGTRRYARVLVRRQEF